MEDTWNLTEGMQHLNGSQALSYARMRKIGNSDWERTERQRTVVSKLIEKAKFISPPSAKSDKFLLGFAKESILPDDVGKKKYYVAGYGENNPATGVLDPPHTHAVWIDDLSGKGGIVIVSIDNVGIA